MFAVWSTVPVCRSCVLRTTSRVERVSSRVGRLVGWVSWAVASTHQWEVGNVCICVCLVCLRVGAEDVLQLVFMEVW